VWLFEWRRLGQEASRKAVSCLGKAKIGSQLLMGLGFEPPAEPDTLKHSAKPTEAKMTNRLHDTEKATLKLMRTYSSTIAAANQKPKPKPVRTPLARHSESKYEQFKKSCMSLPPIIALAVVTQSGRV